MQYWLHYLDGAEATLEIPSDKLQSATEYAAAEQKLTVDSVLHHKLKVLLQDGHFTMNSLLMASWSLVTAKYLNTSDIIVGYVVSGRDEGLQAPEKAIGLFINTLPLRIRWNAETSFEELLSQTNADLMTARDHQWISLGELSRQLSGSSELIRQILVFENYPLDAALMDNNLSKDQSAFQLNPASVKVFDQTHYALYANVYEQHELELQIKYDSNKYSDQLVADFLRWWQDILSAFANESEKKVVQTRLIEQQHWLPSQGKCIEVENLINASERSKSVISMLTVRCFPWYSISTFEAQI
jgi:non-ribosomal peptide synthetase component F